MNDTSSGEVFRLALMWMKECDCVKDADPQQDGLDRWRPTRLLDLSDLKSESYHQENYTSKNITESRRTNLYTGRPKHPDDAEVRLVDTRSARHRNNSYYVTLSHRWGDNKGMQQVMLKQKNLEDLTRGLKLKNLPEHFRNAIEFAATLHNVQYIWIDSLCIIQDSTEDWLIESSLMHQVYSQSYLNISATAAEQSRQWLYLRRKSRIPREAEADLNIKGLPGSRSEKDRVEERRRYEAGMQPRLERDAHKYIRRCMVIDASHFEDLVTQASVNRRAWVLQERLLAPRVLYFCQGQIAWECREHSAAGVLPWGLPTFQRRQNDDIFEEIPLKGLEPLLHGKALRENRLQGMPEPDPHLLENEELKIRLYALELWNRIGEMYSMTELSFSKDKLPALSGIANKMSETIRCGYVAGLWDWNLPSQLLWRVQPEFKRDSNSFVHHGKRPRQDGMRTYRTPSFSWVSLDAGTHNGKPIFCGEVTDQDILVKMESVVIVQSAEQRTDHFGQVSGGHIILWGSIFKVRLYEKALGRHAWQFDDERDLKTQGISKHDFANVYLDCPNDDNEERPIFNSDDIYCLPMALGERSENGKKAHEYMLQCARSGIHNENTRGSEGRQQLLYLV
ncbi:hypothetical protein VPNG_10389 [Cytospora leucostoma]|uniref:Heterokaryon incompatibility domain-containing protein n=1 Tax=Cytospora leucostoma TaxID=1230097 RepID=A0A423V9I8_9PEZI|nr:hypothetical protein VPNG_10389 [Cytospora leucostoma]